MRPIEAIVRAPLRAGGGGAPPLLVVFHGRGADEHDLVDPARTVAPQCAVASPRGTLRAEGGYTWFENRGIGRAQGASLRASAAAVRTWLDGLESQLRFNPARVVLLGFSAGMLLAGALALDEPARYRGAALLSGTLAWDVDEAVPLPGRLAGFPVFLAHGSADRVIPEDLVMRTERYLTDESGAELTARRYRMAHEICGAEIADLTAWIAAVA